MTVVDLAYSQGGGSSPFRVVLAASQDIELESVSATWDGSSAAGEFLPCLALYSQDGVLLSRTYPQGSSLAIGDTAEVTYAPFLRRVRQVL